MNLSEFDKLKIYHPEGAYTVTTITSLEQEVGNKIAEGILPKCSFYEECYKLIKTHATLLGNRLAIAEAEVRILKGTPLEGDGELAEDDVVKRLYPSAMAKVRARGMPETTMQKMAQAWLYQNRAS